MSSHSSLAIANEFIKRSLSKQQNLTQMQVQKLVYIAHGFSLSALQEDLVSDQVEAWDYGPVFPKLYQALRRFGRQPIQEFLNWGDDTPFPFDNVGPAFEDISEEQSAIIDVVWDVYGELEAFQLSALTHADGTPWTKTFVKGRNKPIGNSEIKAHFDGLLGGVV